MSESTRSSLLAALAVILAAWAVLPAQAKDEAPAWTVLAQPDNALGFDILAGDRCVGHIDVAGWGPRWKWVGFRAQRKTVGDEYTASASWTVDKGAGRVIDVRQRVSKSGPDTVTFTYDLSAGKDVPLTLLTATFVLDKSVAGQLVATTAGRTSTLSFPLGKGQLQEVSKAVFQMTDLGAVTVGVEPAGALAYEGQSRFVLGQDRFPTGNKSVKLTFTFPGAVELPTSAAQLQRFVKTVAGPDWFAFAPSIKPSPGGAGVIGMDDWLEKPAGSHGGVRMVGDRFQFTDGTPVKFWGTNLAYLECAPERAAADFTAARFARYGINAVRLHKFSYPRGHMGIGAVDDSTHMDAAGLDRMDYFTAQLKSHGVYFGFSHTYGFHVRGGDRARLAAYDEILKAFPDGNTYALINFAPDIQDLMIEMVVNLLKHKNTYTGLTYAEDPALCFVEMQNEDDIFFWTSATVLHACPTYEKMFARRFCDWLGAKYGTEEALGKAWKGAITASEGLGAGTIMPQTSPWFFSSDHLPQTTGGERRRLLDTAAFLHETQNKFYGRFLKAIRDAGYQGPVNGSPWQAPAMLPHYYNLRSDDLAGYIDRHNYFGGRISDSMLGNPGSGYLSSGLQQVIDRPFGLSEWITVYPSLYSADGPAMVAVYGMGLQGWDASYEFQSLAGLREFDDLAGNLPWGVWNVDTPTQIGQYPALARMIYRGDVKEGPVISVRRVSPADLAQGTFSFTDKVQQSHDVKSFGGSVPAEALAAGRVVVEFTDAPGTSTFADMDKYRQGSRITSATGQLVWDYSGQADGRGFFTVNTDGTKAVVGFAQGKEAVLGDVHITMNCPYASIFLTATDKSSTLADGKSALLTAVARSSNTGFSYWAIQQRILDNGKAPILLEPVKATIAMGGRHIAAVNILDFDGRRTGRTLPVRDGSFAIDGAQDKTLYYEVVFEP